MKKKKIIILFILIFLAVGLFCIFQYWRWRPLEEAEERAKQEQFLPKISEDDKQTVSEYIKVNISELSPEPAVLGGAFYVTSIIFPTNKNCVVEYEDGHIALTAIAEFGMNSEKQVEIKSFELVEKIN